MTDLYNFPAGSLLPQLLERMATRPTAVVQADGTGRILWANAAYTRQSGFDLDTLRSLDLHSLLRQTSGQEPQLPRLLQTLEGGLEYRARLRRWTRQGTSYWAELELQPGCGSNGEPGYLLIERDATDRLRLESLLDAMLAAATEGIIELSQAGDVVSCNKAAEEILGLPADQISGRTPRDPRWGATREDGSHFPGEEHPASMTLATGLPVRNHVHGIRTPDGNLRWVSVSTQPLRDPDGSPAGVIAAVADITKQREQASRLAMIIEGAGLATWELDVDSGQVQRDANWGKMLGYTPDQMPRDVEGWLALIHPEDIASVTAARAGHLTGTNGAFRSEYRLRCADGRWAWVLDAGQILARHLDGSPQRLAGVHIDVSELREAQAETMRVSRRVAEHRSELQAVIDAIPALVFYMDDSNRVLNLNRTAAMMLGKPIRDIRGQPLENFIPLADAAKYLVDDQTVLRDGVPQFGIVEQYQPLNGPRRYLRTDKIPLRSANGRFDRVVSVATDISEQVEHQRTLEEARRLAEAANLAKSEFLANMSHEIRTPLTAILGYADVLAEDTDTLDGQARTQMLHTIQNAGRHLLGIINDILDISKIEAGKMQLERLDMSLVELLGDIEILMRSAASEKHLEFVTTLLTPIPDRILADPTRLRQILVNLAGNAVKFTRAGKVEIIVGTRTTAGEALLRIEVQDSGPGIPAQAAKALFQPFSQGDSSTTRHHGGTGLGLAICRRLATMLGGEVFLVTSAPGPGARFALEIPLQAAPGAQQVTHLPDAASTAAGSCRTPRVQLNAHVLVVEDGEDNRRLITHYLTQCGASVELAEDGERAMAAIEQALQAGRLPDLLISDIQMPRMDGYTLARRLRERGLTLPMIALTAHAMFENRQLCLEAGFDAYHVKPINRAELLTTCELLLTGSSGPGRPDASAPDSSVTKPYTAENKRMLSEFADDEEMQPLIEEFLRELAPKTRQLRALAAAGDLHELGRLAHQLKGSGGGYGYPAITQTAADLEAAVRGTDDRQDLPGTLARLVETCERAIVANRGNSTAVEMTR